MWCLNTTTGYLIQFEPYQGPGTVDIEKSLGMGGSVIVDLIAELPSDRPYRLYFDNLFTSLKLVDILTERGIGATGTVRVNRIEKCPLVDVKMMSKTPEAVDYNA
jgi:Transposase IS4